MDSEGNAERHIRYFGGWFSRLVLLAIYITSEAINEIFVQ